MTHNGSSAGKCSTLPTRDNTQHTTHNNRDPAGQAVNLWGGNRVQQHFWETAELVASPTGGLFAFPTGQFAASRINRRTDRDAAESLQCHLPLLGHLFY